MRLTNLSYDDCLEHVFGHEVRYQQPAWFFDPDADWWDPTPGEAVAYLTRLFEDPEPALRFFADSQIAQGLTYLVGTSATGDEGWLSDASVPLERRLRCVQAIHTLFAKLFAPRCTPHLSHLDEPGAGPLNGVCYMWWDEFPCIALPGDPHRDALHEAALRTMRRTLALDSVACRESALHGLGHWQHHHPDAVATIIEAFLDANPELIRLLGEPFTAEALLPGAGVSGAEPWEDGRGSGSPITSVRRS